MIKKLSIAFIIAVIVAACSGSEKTVSSGVTANLHDFGIELSQSTFASGPITFNLSNDGPSVHEFVIVRSNLDPASLPVVNGKVEESVLDAVDEVEDVAVGSTPQLSVNLQPGSYIVICNIVGHYQAGMHAGFTVS